MLFRFHVYISVIIGLVLGGLLGVLKHAMVCCFSGFLCVCSDRCHLSLVQEVDVDPEADGDQVDELLLFCVRQAVQS